MSSPAFRYVLEIVGEDGVAIGREPVEPDWLPAIECARYQGVRVGKLLSVPSSAAVFVEPVWDNRVGAPYVAGLRAAFRLPDDHEPFSVDLPRAYFKNVARKVSMRFTEEGRVRAGQVFYFKVTAFAANASDADKGRCEPVEQLPQTMEIHDAPIEDVMADAVAVGEPESDDAPVFLVHSVLEEVRELSRDAGDLETGGVLLGHLCRDTADRQLLYLKISAQVLARYTYQQATRLTFTADTWDDARAALGLRSTGESMVGWWHLHPNWCRDCDAARRANCALSGVFFSSDDCALHRTVFPLAHQVALLISDRDAGLVPAMFGWRRGLIVSQAFYVSRGANQSAPLAPAIVAATATVGGLEHVQE